ncbi:MULTISPECIES: cytochrome c oxidase subunit II [Idiomarina]|jgi:cytochrome c oxidase subunit 2|nr:MULTISPECIES: cytochrome c oxidase subunit II [Idiomarina]MAF75414.1 cytochrome c oxidase subunit II [Idiomarinaceae bacterium]MBR38201.1 cytochrome c oxidase subunit II [Idiomarina sp.]MEC8924619.1 cytochrome c oxidase subunit II [Pseudomonadota bacterium]HAR55908.1 cytochrome c oxidase subunit II [Idiomarina baltica]|tara:strand:- start:43 stop:1167 length:1125 start_codon:yes stop_codon:yes gene_type:complete
MKPLWALPLLYSASALSQERSLNLTKGVTEVSRDVYDLHMTIFYICCVIGVVVFGLMFYSMIRHRKSRGREPAKFHENVKVEILWTLIPFLILVGMAIPATSTLIAMEDTSDADVTIQVTGSQWKWHYKYFDREVEFFSRLATQQQQIDNKFDKSENYLREVDNPLVLPTGQKVRFLVTSDDVIHSWWVPDFAVKKDANPGFINEAWTRIDEPGIYRGQCAELCGKDHGFMPIVVIAKTPEDYAKWIDETEAKQIAEQKRQQELLDMEMSMDELMAMGEKIYNSTCAACHQPNGQGISGTFPALAGSPIASKPENIDKHIDIVLHGVQGSAMQAFAQQLTMQELASVITYERNAWGNDTGEMVQAADINAAMNK